MGVTRAPLAACVLLLVLPLTCRALAGTPGNLNYEVRVIKHFSSPQRTLEQALAAAAKPDASQRPVVIAALVDGLLSRLHLPIFLESLQEVGAAQQLVIFTLDDEAQEICQQIHDPSNCAREFGSTTVKDVEIPILRDEGGGFGTWYGKGWLKTSVTLKILAMGYDCMFMDIDQVAFKNPLLTINANTDVAVTVDCHENYDPRTEKEYGGPNLGITYFKSNAETLHLVQTWMQRGALERWDQTEFKYALEEAAERFRHLEIQMLRKNHFPVLCCGYCHDFVKPLVSRSMGWRDHCPAEERENWVVFHATCVNHFRENTEVEYDEKIQKQNIMLMMWDLVKPKKSGAMLKRMLLVR